jgi:DNA polymerase III epsilon subunit family exonuclease
MKAIIFDTETTGLLMPSVADIEKQPKIIEIGALAVDENGVVGELSQLLNPNEILDPQITKITGIKDEDLVGKPSFIEFLPQLKEFFDGTDFLICHNAPFDTGLLKNDLVRADCDDFPWPAEIICTVQEYKPQFGYRPKLLELYERILGRKLAQTHRALDDVHALYEAIKADGFMDLLFGVENE